jgi:regulatory protein
MLARREHSGSEVVAKLARKGCPREVASEVVGDLVAQGLLSDERFAASVVRSRKRRGYGPVRIRQELTAKGLSSDEVARCVDVRAREWIDEIERVRRRKFGVPLPRGIAERAKQARFLQYRGFTYDQIQQVLRARKDD